jgi:hypothetical protein
MININNITTKAFCDIYDLDTKYVGTKNYLGLAFFWNREYRHYMRDISSAKRKKIHNLFIQNNLDIAGNSNKHFEIIKKVTKFN